mmetsp:Transcript_29096/g.70973  ORF Transcript_29096/g.70973 Transcript_29096/m.70973 type:complete len:85 (-) Transcript_29096:265-519(-)
MESWSTPITSIYGEKLHSLCHPGVHYFYDHCLRVCCALLERAQHGGQNGGHREDFLLIRVKKIQVEDEGNQAELKLFQPEEVGE